MMVFDRRRRRITPKYTEPRQSEQFPIDAQNDQLRADIRRESGNVGSAAQNEQVLM
jgi:hypothetical protein